MHELTTPMWPQAEPRVDSTGKLRTENDARSERSTGADSSGKVVDGKKNADG